MEIVIRLAAPGEGASVARMRSDSTLERGSDPPDIAEFLADCAAAVEAGIASGWLRPWLAFDGARAVGTATLQMWPTLPRIGGRSPSGAARDGRVRNVYVEPEYRRRGIARRLVCEVLADAKRLRIDRLALGSSEIGRPLYESLGFASKDDELVYLWP